MSVGKVLEGFEHFQLCYPFLSVFSIPRVKLINFKLHTTMHSHLFHVFDLKIIERGKAKVKFIICRIELYDKEYLLT